MTNMNNEFEGKRVLVTGASSGLGEACASEFARRGAEVILVARRKTRLRNACREIRHFGGKADYFCVDLAVPHETITLCKTVKRVFGDVHILINNAAGYLDRTLLEETSLMSWDDLLNTNLRAPFLLCKEFVPRMREFGYGRIVNVISATKHIHGIAPFRISKVGLEILSRALAKEVTTRNVAITAFNPGWMKTEISSTGRSPKTVARLLCELVLRPASFSKGQIVDLVWRGRRGILRRRAM